MLQDLFWERINARIDKLAKENDMASNLLALDDVGALTATAVVATTGGPSVFKNGRDFSAWLGLVPRQHSTGGKTRMLAITKRGDSYLRILLIHGARTVLLMASRDRGKHKEWIISFGNEKLKT